MLSKRVTGQRLAMVSKRGWWPGVESVNNHTMDGGDKSRWQTMQQARGDRRHNNHPLTEASEMQNSGLTTRGAVLLGTGSLALVALVLLAVRKRRSLSRRTSDSVNPKTRREGGGEEDLDGKDNPDNGDTDVDSWSLSLFSARGGLGRRRMSWTRRGVCARMPPTTPGARSRMATRTT